MAATKIWPVKGRVGRLIDYVLNPSKTERMLFATGINCVPGSAAAEMDATKRLYGKTGGTVAFHGYQSFMPGEVAPEAAHEIGCRLARELWGGRFQIVVATHLDKGHVHNHFAINSVSFADGTRFHSDARLYRSMRRLSDRLCAEHGLSVIQNPEHGRSRQYAEWRAEREGRPTWRSIVKADVDEAIAKAATDRQFYRNLRNIGYEVKQGKDISVRPPGKERFVRLARNFGEAYTYEGIAARILASERPRKPIPEPKASAPRPEKLPPLPKGSVAALYRHYLYLFGYYGGGKSPDKRMHFLLAEDLRNFDDIVREEKLLEDRRIGTDRELLAHMDRLEADIKLLRAERKAIRTAMRKQQSPETGRTPRIEQIDAQMKTLRREMRHCANIAKRSGVLQAKIARMEREQAEQMKRKEAERDGRSGPSGRADRAHDARR